MDVWEAEGTKLMHDLILHVHLTILKCAVRKKDKDTLLTFLWVSDKKIIMFCSGILIPSTCSPIFKMLSSAAKTLGLIIIKDTTG